MERNVPDPYQINPTQHPDGYQAPMPISNDCCSAISAWVWGSLREECCIACGCLGSPIKEAYKIHICQGSLMEEVCEAHMSRESEGGVC